MEQKKARKSIKRAGSVAVSSSFGNPNHSALSLSLCSPFLCKFLGPLQKSSSRSSDQENNINKTEEGSLSFLHQRMMHYQRYQQWRKGDANIYDVDEESHGLVVLGCANSAYYKRKRPKLFYLLIISLLSCSFLLAPQISSSSSFSLFRKNFCHLFLCFILFRGGVASLSVLRSFCSVFLFLDVLADVLRRYIWSRQWKTFPNWFQCSPLFFDVYWLALSSLFHPRLKDQYIVH